jgi:hypothetical protein
VGSLARLPALSVIGFGPVLLHTHFDSGHGQLADLIERFPVAAVARYATPPIKLTDGQYLKVRFTHSRHEQHVNFAVWLHHSMISISLAVGLTPAPRQTTVGGHGDVGDDQPGAACPLRARSDGEPG